jgi:hypothetical protein
VDSPGARGDLVRFGKAVKQCPGVLGKKAVFQDKGAE